MSVETESDDRPASVGLPDAGRAAKLQRRWTEAWHEETKEHLRRPQVLPDSFVAVLEQEHRANFDLWHAEDLARDPQASDAEVAAVKRQIDASNQRRNDLIERLDEVLLDAAGRMAIGAPLHSETPGMMLDRMSILALKIFHTEEEIARPLASEAHRRWNGTRLQTLEEQRADLTDALRELLVAVSRGQRRFKVYRQLKMYNDPDLNPQIYRSAGWEGAGQNSKEEQATAEAPERRGATQAESG